MKKSVLKKEPMVYRYVISALYFFVLSIMIFIVITNIIGKKGYGADIGLEGFETMNDDWYTENGEVFQLDEIDKLRSPSGFVMIYHPLPDLTGAGESIVFRSKNCYVEASIGDSVIYQTDVAEAPFYNHSPGTRWNIISIHPEDLGKVLTLKITQAYEDGRAKVDNFYWGDRADIVLYLIESKLGGFLVSLMILFVAIIFFTAWLVLNVRRSAWDNSLLWLALFATAASIWSLLETNLFQLFSQHLRLIQVINNMMLLVGGLPLFFYLDSVYQIFHKRIIRLFCALNVAYLLFATLSQLVGFLDYHQTLNGAISTYGIFIFVLMICLVNGQKKLGHDSAGYIKYIYFLQRAGIITLGIGLFMDLFYYLTSDVLDRAFFIRIGLLFFIILFGAGNIYQMIVLVQKGAKTDFISRLAYLDGLTQLNNRTAYMDKIEIILKTASTESLGIVMFDINNLKMVNDTYGHKAGDELILVCSEILRSSFSPDWELYRIGGDEFAALKCGTEVKSSYENAAKHFQISMEECQNKSELDYPVQIAMGASFCDHITKETLEQTELQADQQMYQNKYEIKFQKSGNIICSE